MASVYLFESHAMGRHWDRVLGLGVLFDPSALPDTAARGERLDELAQDLAESFGEVRLDLVVLNDLAPGVGRRIVTEGRRLVHRLPEVDRDFLRDVQVHAVDLEAFQRRPRRPRLEMASR